MFFSFVLVRCFCFCNNIDDVISLCPLPVYKRCGVCFPAKFSLCHSVIALLYGV